MNHYTEVGRPPVEKKEGNCPHCNSRRFGQLWACGTFRATPDNQTRGCRIFQLEATLDAIEELRAEDYIIIHSGTQSGYKYEPEAVEVAAEWTNGETEWFHGDTMADALNAALEAKAAAQAAKET